MSNLSGVLYVGQYITCPRFWTALDGEEKREKGMVMDMSLLEIRGLETEFQTEQGVVKALRGIDYTVDKGEVLGIVGESGSGKSVGMLSLMGLLAPNGTVTAGRNDLRRGRHFSG